MKKYMKNIRIGIATIALAVALGVASKAAIELKTEVETGGEKKISKTFTLEDGQSIALKSGDLTVRIRAELQSDETIKVMAEIIKTNTIGKPSLKAKWNQTAQITVLGDDKKVAYKISVTPIPKPKGDE